MYLSIYLPTTDSLCTYTWADKYTLQTDKYTRSRHTNAKTHAYTLPTSPDPLNNNHLNPEP